MSRIRTIKPDFWTDEKLTECSLSARLFFIGTWNFADDNGNLQRSARKLKMQIFPADNIDCEPLIQELLDQGILMEYEEGEEKFLHIKGFTRHQVINRPSKSRIPQPQFSEHSVSVHGVITDGMEGKGREGKGREQTNKANALFVDSAADDMQHAAIEPSRPAKPACPHQAIVKLYHEILPSNPVIRDWTPARQEVLRTRWNEDAARQTLDWWAKFFRYVAKSRFLTGRASTPGRKPFVPGLEWLCKAENFAKIREGRYEDEEVMA